MSRGEDGKILLNDVEGDGSSLSRAIFPVFLVIISVRNALSSVGDAGRA